MATRPMRPAATARPRLPVTLPPALTVTGRLPLGVGVGRKTPVPTELGTAVMRVLVAVAGTSPAGAVLPEEPVSTAAAPVEVAGTMATELSEPVPVVKATWGTVNWVEMTTVELEEGTSSPALLVTGTTVVATTLTVV